jgi:Family of unknown function (DUF6328)
MSRAEESERDQLARNLNELLQEVRVAQTGVQILVGFLLSIAFTERYAHAGAFIKTTHLLTVLFAVTAVALFIAPAAWHRMLFRQGLREEIIQISDRFAVAGLVSLAIAMSGTAMLLAEVAFGGWPSVVIGLLVGLGFSAIWFILPARRRRAVSRSSSDVP